MTAEDGEPLATGRSSEPPPGDDDPERDGDDGVPDSERDGDDGVPDSERDGDDGVPDSESDGDDGVPDPRDGLTDPGENVPPAEAPDVEAPSVGVDAPAVPSPEDAPADLRAEFWELVIAFNVAFFALALGAMLVVLQGQALLGGGSLALGALALAYGVHGYLTREHTP